MKVLPPTQTIAAVATYDAVVCLTLWGMELNTATGAEDYKVLAQVLVSNNATVIYSAPATGPAFISGITVVNTNVNNPCAFQLFRGGIAASNAITPKFQLSPGGFCEYGEQGWDFFRADGGLLSSPFGAPNVRNLGFSGVVAENMSRELVDEVTQSINTGTLALTAISLSAGMLVSSLSCCTGTVPATTHAFMGLYNANRKLLAQTADLLDAFPTQSVITAPVVSPFRIEVSDLYYVGVFMVSIGGNMTLRGKNRLLNQLTATSRALCGSSNAGLTTALPDPANAITPTLGVAWAAVS